MKKWMPAAVAALGCALFVTAAAGTRSAQAAKAPTFAAYVVDPTGKALGQVTFVGVDTGGVEILVDLSGLPPGMHGMHIHEYGSCNQMRDTTGAITAFGAAGGHFDPQGTGHHMGPEGAGHAGDLPMLNVNVNGYGASRYYSNRLSVVSGPTNIVGRSIVIHALPDNYTDTPPNGGSDGRIACGEIGPLRVQ